MQGGDLVGDRSDETDMMGNDDHRDIAPRPQVADDPGKTVHFLLGQPGTRLIHQQHAWPPRHRAHDVEDFLFRQGQLRRRDPAPLRRKFDRVEGRLGHDFANGGPGQRRQMAR